jgi:hypothetical protein
VSLILRVQTALLSDDEDQSDRLSKAYDEADIAGKAVLDDAFAALCGYTLGHLIEAQTQGNPLEDNDV